LPAFPEIFPSSPPSKLREASEKQEKQLEMAESWGKLGKVRGNWGKIGERWGTLRKSQREKLGEA
jgi:hypothetical protein